jgi:hypothetical protein
MTWYPDLSHGCMAGSGEDVRAIGWLSGDHAFPTGPVPPAALEALRAHLRAPWMPFWFGGTHQCDVAAECASPLEGPTVDSRNLYVPSNECMYIAPAMILHYAEAHRYQPPAEFLAALLRCPAQDSVEYHALLRPFLVDGVDGWFDREGNAKRAAAFHRAQLWVRRGRCPKCDFWQYLHEGDAPEHCGTALVDLEERAGPA